MSAHPVIIEAGPGIIRRLCCGTGTLDDAEMATAALDGIDDPVVLVDARPVSIDSLWCDVLRSLDCGGRHSMVVIHPSWWAARRVATLTTAARSLADDVTTRPRSWLLAQASPIGSERTAVVEIADHFVVVTGAEVVAERRRAEPQGVAEAVARAVVEMTRGATSAVVIDAPSTVGGAAALAATIADAVRHTGPLLSVVSVDDTRLQRLAVTAVFGDPEPPASQPGDSAGDARLCRWVPAVLVVAGVALAVTVAGFGRHRAPAVDGPPTTFLVEGRVALMVPAGWPTERVVAGPGSARVQVASRSDPEVMLHVTQSPVGAETLADTAESLKHAIDGEPPGVFVDFNPSGRSADRPAVTYREVRAGHDIRWTVVLDGTVRISIGCQSRAGDDDAVREACELAVRSAHALR